MALLSILAAAALAASAAGRVYTSEHYDTQDQARAAMQAFKAEMAALGYRLTYDPRGQQVGPVGDSFYFALAYDGFAVPQPQIYSSMVYASPEKAKEGLRWFTDASLPLDLKIVEKGVRARADQSYFWARYLGDSPRAEQLASPVYQTEAQASGGLQSCLGYAARARSVVLEKDLRLSNGQPFYLIRYAGPKPACPY